MHAAHLRQAHRNDDKIHQPEVSSLQLAFVLTTVEVQLAVGLVCVSVSVCLRVYE